jgi:hypothetical protein
MPAEIGTPNHTKYFAVNPTSVTLSQSVPLQTSYQVKKSARFSAVGVEMRWKSAPKNKTEENK